MTTSTAIKCTGQCKIKTGLTHSRCKTCGYCELSELNGLQTFEPLRQDRTAAIKSFLDEIVIDIKNHLNK